MGANVECKLEVNRTFTDNIDSHETPSLSSQSQVKNAKQLRYINVDGKLTM